MRFTAAHGNLSSGNFLSTGFERIVEKSDGAVVFVVFSTGLLEVVYKKQEAEENLLPVFIFLF